jgi:hypothetical protein
MEQPPTCLQDVGCDDQRDERIKGTPARQRHHADPDQDAERRPDIGAEVVRVGREGERAQPRSRAPQALTLLRSSPSSQRRPSLL